MSGFQTNTVPLTFSSFDDFLNDGPPIFKIPPLKSVFLSPSSERPATLEPAANQNVDEATSKLTGRQLALAQAKVIEEPYVGELEVTIDPFEEHNKKRRKLAHKEQLLDFVQLPKPKPKLDEVNKKPFQPIAVLNELNEPPPSAAMFPPITPSHDDQSHTGTPKDDEHARQNVVAKVGQHSKVKSEKRKRISTRPRRKWTEEESNDLMEGVALCGVGRWKNILDHPKLHFHESRTHVDLKDRFRTLYPQHQPERWADPDGKKPPIANTRSKTQGQRTPPTKTGKHYRSWTDEEDEELEKGLKMYGFQWHLMAQDQSLRFDRRSAAQIRDRFRRKYPDAYREAPQAPRYKRCRKKVKERPEESGGWDRASGSMTAPDDEDNVRSGTMVREFHLAGVNGSSTAPTFPSGLLNRGEEDDDESEFTRSLAALDNDLKLPPLQWDDMAVQPIFDLG